MNFASKFIWLIHKHINSKKPIFLNQTNLFLYVQWLGVPNVIKN